MTNTYPSTYVAVFDVLGFKNLVSNNTHEDLIKKYDGLSFAAKMSVSGSSIKASPDGHIELGVLEKAEVNTLFISDNIICWTKNDSCESFYHIVKTARDLLWAGIEEGLPMRGAITLGTLSVIRQNYESRMDNFQDSILGKPIVDAFLMEKRQEWSGCVIDEKCIKKYSSCKNEGEFVGSSDFIEEKFWLKYGVPCKNGQIAEEYVINWPMGGNRPPSKESVRKSFSLHKKKTDGLAVERKIQNTIKFLDDTNK